MLTAVLVFVSAFVHVRTSAQSRAKAESRTSPQKSAPCPLTDAQTSKSIDAFAKIANSLTREPRCVNCHGGVNPHIKDTGLDQAMRLRRRRRSYTEGDRYAGKMSHCRLAVSS